MMLGITAEQEELRDSVRRFLADRSPLPRVRELMAADDACDRRTLTVPAPLPRRPGRTGRRCGPAGVLARGQPAAGAETPSSRSSSWE